MNSKVLRLLVLVGVLLTRIALAQNPADLTLGRIFNSDEFELARFGPARWLDNGEGYTTLETAASGNGTDIVRYDTKSGERTILVSAGRLIPEGASMPLTIDNYEWSADKQRLLIFTNSKRVWRTNTRGDYWVLDLKSWRLQKLGGDAKPSTLMFAKFSPKGRRVGYVRENNVYVEELQTGVPWKKPV